MNFNVALEYFLETQKKMSRFGAAGALLGWDMQTVMPKKGGAARAQVLGVIQSEMFSLFTSDRFGEAMETLAQSPDRLTPRQRRMLEEARWSYTRSKKIPADEFSAFAVASSESTFHWMEARSRNDFESFKPWLQKMIDYSRRFAEYYGYADKPYDAMLAEYDPAMLTAQLDPIFARLLRGTRDLMARVGPSPVTLPRVTVPADRQQQIGEYLLRAIGYDMDAGNLFTTEHPFSSGIHAGDVRVTTKYHPDAPFSSIFSVLHEGGHGMYEQNISEELDGTNLHGGHMGLHESQSRFWENVVGRSLPFWQTHLDEVNCLAGVSLAATPEELFRGVNLSAPSLIRIEADELTYNLHIIIRYECEKAIFNEGVNAEALPQLWREKYREYLGIVPETYAEGVMQDTHWSGGMFGYFPSYTIGNLCAAQFTHAFEKQHGPLAGYIGTPEGIAKIGGWLKENIHRFGKEEKPAEIMERVCGENVNPQYFLDYIEAKLKDVYPGF